MHEFTEARFELRRVADQEWLILDHRYRADDPRRTVGCVYEVEGSEVEVMWTRDIPLALRYMSAVEALDDVLRCYTEEDRARAIPEEAAPLAGMGGADASRAVAPTAPPRLAEV